MINFNRINQEALPCLRDLVAELAGESPRQDGRELLIRNPRREDSSPGSFSINVDSGKWKDFASGDGGSDPVSLVAFIRNENQQAAALWLAKYLGLQKSEFQAEGARPAKAKPQAPTYPRVVLPVPPEAPPLPHQRAEQGRWEWKDATGRLLKLAVRQADGKGGKVFHPWAWCESAPGAFGWKSMELPTPRPLFGLDRLARCPGAPVLVTEGEKAALAAEALFPHLVAVTSGPSTSARAADWSPLEARDVVIWPDADGPGETYALAVEGRLRAVGPKSLRRVVLPPNLPKAWDLADPAPAGVDLRALLDAAVMVDLGNGPGVESESIPAGLPNRAGCYLIHEGSMSMENAEGIRQNLCNFTARIREELVLDDGETEDLFFLVEGTLSSGAPLPLARVPAGSFAGLGWIMAQWGARAIVNAGTSRKDQLRAAVQHLSRPVRRRAFLNIGWRKLEGQWCYLHAGGAIGPGGPVESVDVDLRGRLALFTLADPLQGAELAQALRSSLRTLDLGPGAVTVPVWLSPFRAVVDDCPFSIHISGSKGHGKTELASIAAGHFGPALEAKEPLESWESTPAALERALFLAKDALGLVDDFRPQGGPRETADLFKKADRILRGAYNRASRSRLSSDAKTQRTAYWSRGLILSTGEDLPDGESLRSRVLCLEWGAGDMCWPVLDGLQADRAAGLHAGLMAAFIQWQARDRDRAMKLRREAHADARRKLREAGENNRTGDIASDLWSAWPVLEAFAVELRIMPPAELAALGRRLWASILEMIGAQASIISEANPAERFKEGFTSCLGSGRGHLAHGELGDLPPEWKARCGWQGDQAKGPRLGYLAPRKGEVWLIPSAAFQEAARMVSFGVGERALWKRLQESEWLVLERVGRNKARRSLPEGGRPDFVVVRLGCLWGVGQSGNVGQYENPTVPAETHATTDDGPFGTFGTPKTYTPPLVSAAGDDWGSE